MPKAKELPPVELLRELFDYNPETGELRWKVRLANCVEIGDIAGCYASRGYVCLTINGVNYKQHRIIYSLYHGEVLQPHEVIDHINRDTGDNRIANLRRVTQCENNLNRGEMKNNRSGKRGVTWCEARKKWRVRLCLGGKRHHLGEFDCLDDAISARLAAEKNLPFELS